MSVLKYSIFTKFIPNHITCLHNIPKTLLYKTNYVTLATLIQILTQKHEKEEEA
jgi:hypothetical protein